MVFITAGMGGGTGTGASPVIAQDCQGGRRADRRRGHEAVRFRGQPAQPGGRGRHHALRENVDALITIPNERLLDHGRSQDARSTEAFRIADDVLRQGIDGISDLITKPGMINLDFADVRTIMRDAGSALMAIGYGAGREPHASMPPSRRSRARCWKPASRARPACSTTSPAARSLTLLETSEAAEIIRAAVDEDAEIIYGTSIDESLGDAVRITLIATGFDDHESYQPYSARPPSRRRARRQEPVYRSESDRREQREPRRERQPNGTRERERPPSGNAADASNQPPARVQHPAPMLPDDDWEGESSIIRFLRER